MKLNLHLLTFGLAASLFAFGEARGAEISVETKVQSLYVERGLKRAEGTWFPSVEVSRGNVYLGSWAALPLEKAESPNVFQDEVDFYAGYSWAVSDKWGMDLGGTYHRLAGASDSKEIYLGLFGELGSLSPAFYLYNDFDTDDFLLEASVTLAVPLAGFPFEATGRIGLLEGDVDYRYFGLDLVYPLELNDAARLSLGLHYDGNDFSSSVPDSNLYGSASVQLRF